MSQYTHHQVHWDQKKLTDRNNISSLLKLSQWTCWYDFSRLTDEYLINLFVFIGVVSESKGQMEETQEDNKRFPQSRCPPAIALSAPIRVHGWRLLLVWRGGSVAHVPNGSCPHTAPWAYLPSQAAGSRTIAVPTQCRGGRHGRHESGKFNEWQVMSLFLTHLTQVNLLLLCRIIMCY